MNKLLALDISTKCGYAILNCDDEGPAAIITLGNYGLIRLPQTAASYADGKYPWSYVAATRELATKIGDLVNREKPDAIVIEETNLGKSRYTQKLLEFLHLAVLLRIEPDFEPPTVCYVSSSTWRGAIGLVMPKEDRKANKALKAAKKAAAAAKTKLDKKALGLAGKVTAKHLAVRYVNDRFGLGFKQKDNDIADAICIGVAWLTGACDRCTGY